MNSEKFSNFLTDLVEYTKKIKFEATGKLKNKDNFLNSEKYSGIKQKINDFHSKKSEISNVSFENLKKLEIYWKLNHSYQSTSNENTKQRKKNIPTIRTNSRENYIGKLKKELKKSEIFSIPARVKKNNTKNDDYQGDFEKNLKKLREIIKDPLIYGL